MTAPTTAETPTMRERLARALASECFGNHISPGGNVHDYVHDCWPDYLDRVDAILREMLEPSGVMKHVGSGVMMQRQRPTHDAAADVFRSMIQHILNETKD